MYYPNYNPFYAHNRNYFYQSNTGVQKRTPVLENKKDTDSSNNDTISFKDFCSNSTQDSNTKTSTNSREKKSRLFSINRDTISILGFDLEIDDLIILALIILLLRDFNENYALIIILGLILLNVNLNDILNIF